MNASPVVTDIELSEAQRLAGKRAGRRFFLFDRELIADYEESEQERLIAAFEAFFYGQDGKPLSSEPGRAAITRYVGSDGSPFIFRRYKRGGFVAKLVENWFCRLGRKYRPVEEFRVLKRLAQAGCAVPRPLGALVETRCGGMFYRGALAMKEIPAAKNLLHALRQGLSENDAARFVEEAGREARRALREGISHGDLHLGNIVVSAGERVYLLDWDKSRPAERGSAKLLIERFGRSVRKHGNSERLVERFSAGLEEQQ